MAHHSTLLARPKKIKAIYTRRWLWLWLTVALLILPLTALAQSGDTPRPAPVILTDSRDKYPLGLHLEFLEDPTRQLTIEDVSSPAYADQFSPNQAAIPNFGATAAAVWVRFQICNQADPTTAWYLAIADARPEHIDMYLPSEDGTGWEHEQADRSYLFNGREVPYRYGVFKLPLPAGQPQTYYLRVQGNTPYLLPLTLWSLEAFSRHAQNEQLVFGLFYGVMLVMLGYNLVLFASPRDRSYLYLALFIACFGMNDAIREGMAQQYLWPAWRNLYELEITATLIYIVTILFGVTFLQTKIHTPGIHRILMATIPVSLLIFFYYLLTGGGSQLYSILVLLALILLVVAGFMTWWRGHRPARYYLLAWLVILGATFFHQLTNTGLLPGTSFGQESIRFGGALMVLLLSLALADRINLLKVETEQANLVLTDSERRLNQYLEAMPVGVVVYDAMAKLNYANQRARRLLAMSNDSAAPDRSALTLDQEVVRTSPYVAGSEQPYPPERMPVTRALQGEAATVDDMEIRGPEQRIQLEVWASPIIDEQRGLQYAITAFQDITRRKQLELELRYQRDQLEEVVAERTRELSEF